VLYAFVGKQKKWKMRRKFLEEGKKCSYKLVMMKGAQCLKMNPESWWRKSEIKSKRKFHSWTVHEGHERE
jgi:hypothetical protein